MTSLPPAVPRPPRLYRSPDARVVAGVARGLADHLGIDVRYIRWAFVALSFTGGIGIALYGGFWIFAPQALAPMPHGTPGREHPEHRRRQRAALLGGAVVILLAVSALGGVFGVGLVWPLFLALLGLAVVWRQADEARREQWLATARGSVWHGLTRTGRMRALAGAVLVLTGAVLFVGSRASLNDAGPVVTAGVVVLVGVGLISAPWWLQMARQLSEERAARIREQERAELAAHVHDSVLHTLTLIQRHVDNPREVARLARSQERALRTWLYRPRPQEAATVAAALEQIAGEVEDTYGAQVEVVAVGDCPVDEKIGALLQAAREALVNAGKHARPPAGPVTISLYAEVEPEQVTVFVRDRGPGFDLQQVPDDRLGVRQSILGRMERNGGRAAVHSVPGEGTEVQLEMPRGRAGVPEDRGDDQVREEP